MGAGGVGAYVGGMLAKSGARVALVCRGAHLEAIRNRGLKLLTPGGEFTIEGIDANDDPAGIGPVDVIVQSVKLYDLRSSSRQMLPMVGRNTMVVPLQNGMTAREEIGAIVGAEHVVGGLVFINAMLASPGVVRSASEVKTLTIGEPDGRISPRVTAFRDVCAAAGIDARVTDNVLAEQWRKFVALSSLSAVGCLSRQPMGAILGDWSLRDLYVQAMAEVVSLAAAKGVALEEDIVEKLLAVSRRFPYEAKVSMLEDLEAGKRLELDWLSGWVSREAAYRGVPTPFHDMAYACLRPLARNGREDRLS